MKPFGLTIMNNTQGQITVFYDGACARCIKDRRFYEKLAGKGGKQVQWFDITDQDAHLIGLGIEPSKALTELHIQLADGRILSELDAYIILMARVVWLKPLAYFISIPFIRPRLAKLYHQRVEKRLAATKR
jgi:predicted DCC family thiol-disulfide oxidoreductase YuxK